MNFKGFLKKTGFLNEDGGDEAAKVSFIKNAYRKSYPNSDPAKANRPPEELWNAVLKKASYKLTQNSKEGTKKAVQFAKGARTQGTKRFQLTDTYEKTEKDTMRANLLGHLEDWDEKDFQDLKQALPNNSFITRAKNLEELKSQISQMRDANDLSADLQKSTDELFGEIKKLETVEEKEKEWKDKTFDDPESISKEDFDKLDKEKLKEILGDKLGDKELSYENLKDILKNGDLDDTKIGELDKLIPEPEKTPANQDPPAEPNPPAETGRPETANRDHQRQMEEMEKKRKLEKKLKDNDIPVKKDGTPDFDNPKTLEKINELMINGDDELYKEYILAKGGNQSDLAKQIAQDTAKENELIRTDIENRTARREAEKDQQKAICNIALALDVIFSFLAGKTQDGFSTLANKRVQAKALETQLKTAFNDDTKFQETQKEIETAHNAELENITKKEKQRLSEIERDRQTPRGTPAFKRKAMELSQERDKKRDEWKKRKDAYMPKVNRQGKIKDYLFTLDTSTPIDTNNPVLKELIPQNDGESPEAYATRLQTETSDPVKLKEKLQAESDEIQQTVENFNAEEKQIEADYQKSLNDLEADPEVQSEFKDANAAYEFKKANIQAEMNVLRAKEEKRYKDRISVNKQIFEEREKLLKNVATLSQWSSDPKEVMRTEFLNFNRKAKSMYESRGLTFNEDNDPALSDNDKVLKEYFDNFEKNMSDRIKQREQAQQGQGKGKKDDETGGQKPQRPPFGGHKPNETDGGEGGEPDPEKKKTKPGEGQKQLTQLQTEFGQKPKAKKRLDAFLKEKGLNPDDPDVNDDEIKKAIEEFKGKPFPEPANLTGQELENLGITDADIPEDLKTNKSITDLEKYAAYLKDKNNAEALEKLKEELGFEGTGGLPKPKPKIEIKNFDQTKLQGVKVKDANGNEIEITQENFEPNKYKPQVLAAFSKDEIETPDDINNESAEDQTQDPKEGDPDYETKKKKLKSYSLKTLWTKLNKAGISIRALPDYDPNWTVVDKKKAIAEYIGKHSNDIQEWNGFVNESKNLTHRKTAFKRLNEMSQAQKRASDRRTLRKFSELLVKDFRDFT